VIAQSNDDDDDVDDDDDDDDDDKDNDGNDGGGDDDDGKINNKINNKRTVYEKSSTRLYCLPAGQQSLNNRSFMLSLSASVCSFLRLVVLSLFSAKIK
jgi:hypothetical protein